ncbi:15006_t:CDS:2, partial [Racocetra fulgida]
VLKIFLLDLLTFIIEKMSYNSLQNLQEVFSSQFDQNELQEHLVDIQTLVLSDDENEYDYEPVFDFEQNLYEKAVDLAEYEDDPWKELDAEDITIFEYTEEIPEIKAKPTTPYVIIDNEHGKIRRCNETSNKRLRELIGVWKIDMDAVNEVNNELHLLGVCSKHFNYDQNTVYSKKLKEEQWGHLHIHQGSGCREDPGCTAEHSDDTTTALYHFARLIEMVAQSENDGTKEHLLQALFPCLRNLDFDSPSAQTNRLPSLFVVNTALKVKGLNFYKQIKQFTLNPKKCKEFGESLALDVLNSRATLSFYRSTLENPESLQHTLDEAVSCDEPEKHPLFEISNQLTPSGYENIFTCYDEGRERISKIIRQDILKTEKRIAKGRMKKNVIPLLLGKKVAQSKKRKQDAK